MTRSRLFSRRPSSCSDSSSTKTSSSGITRAIWQSVCLMDGAYQRMRNGTWWPSSRWNRKSSRSQQLHRMLNCCFLSGYSFTQKLEGMFNDMRLSSDMMKSFEKYTAKHEVGRVLQANVSGKAHVRRCASSHWRSISTSMCLPLRSGREKVRRLLAYSRRYSTRRFSRSRSSTTRDIQEGV